MKFIAKDGVTGLNKKQPILCLSDDDSEEEDDKTKINISNRSRKASKRKAIDVDVEDESGDDDLPPETTRELSKLRVRYVLSRLTTPSSIALTTLRAALDRPN